MGAEGDLATTRLARGCRCFAVWVEGGLGGYGWLSNGPEWIGELQLEITPRPGEAYIWNCVTLTEHRRKGIFRSLLLGISEHARKEGMRRLWIGSVDIPAEKAVGPAGFEPVLHFTGVELAGLHLMRVTARDPSVAAQRTDVLSVRPGLHIRPARRLRH